MKAYGAFIRARVDANASLLAQKAPAPGLLIVEPSGTYVLAWKDWFNLTRYLIFLRLARDEANDIVAASKLRETDAAEADLILGNAAVRSVAADRARELFSRAQSEFKRRGNAEREQYAQMGYDLASFIAGDKKKAHEDLARLLPTATVPRNRVYGYTNLGMMLLFERDHAGAVAAYREVLAAATPGSLEAEDARSALAELGAMKATPPQPQMIRIVAPPRTTITGHAEFKATADASVKRVSWSLDGVAIASSDHPPFAQSLDLGTVPRMHTIKATALNADGVAIAEAMTTVNDRIDFRVALLSPLAAELSGKTVVEASVEAPPDHTIKNVELFWNETKLGTFTSPPYRADFDTPRAFGYFRAVATLDDGRVAEQTHIVNAPAIGENVDVHTIAFATTVKDAKGERVNGLTAADFKATDEGEPVTLKVRDEEEPVTIGLAIDSSLSMRDILLDTIETAWSFANVVVSPRDRVFLVAFDSQPHLVESPTTDREALKNAVFDMVPNGGTALVDGIAFALQQFTGLSGKKALLIITDAREGKSTQTSVAAAQMAKESGVPIYFVVPRGEKEMAALANGLDPEFAARSQGGGDPRALSAKPFVYFVGNQDTTALNAIAAASGGTLYFAPRRGELASIFTRVRDEVRGQYVLSFVSHATKPGQWRAVRVSVDRPATVHTIGGYYPR